MNPKRREFKIPNEFKQEFDFLAMYKVRTSIFRNNIQYLIVRAKSAPELSPTFPAYPKPSQQMAAQMELTQGEEF